MTTIYDVNVLCEGVYPDDGKRCGDLVPAHVHQPTPCANGKDARHHAFVPPRSVTVRIGGQTRRIRLDVQRFAAEYAAGKGAAE